MCSFYERQPKKKERPGVEDFQRSEEEQRWRHSYEGLQWFLASARRTICGHSALLEKNCGGFAAPQLKILGGTGDSWKCLERPEDRTSRMQKHTNCGGLMAPQLNIHRVQGWEKQYNNSTPMTKKSSELLGRESDKIKLKRTDPIVKSRYTRSIYPSSIAKLKLGS
uniref:Uncharacterized protein n=1 Tax=Steinernema glaseri TaxID=37863 RepID=A0A1I8ANN3_9BILA